MSNPRATSFFSGTAALAAAAIGGQIVSFAGALLNARLYGPSEVGQFALFVVIWGFVSLVASWRYELAIVTASDEQVAGDLAILVILIGVAGTVIGVAALVAIEIFPAGSALSVQWRHALWACIAGLPVASAILAGSHVCVRQRRFGRVAIHQLVLSLTTVGAQIALVGQSVPGGGLIAGFVIGQVCAVAILVRPLAVVASARLGQHGLKRRLEEAAYVYRGHFLFTAPYTVATQLYYQAPIVILSIVVGPREVGLFSLAYRTTFTPFQVLPTAVAQVIFPDLARDRDRLLKWEARLQTVVIALGLLMAPAAALILAGGSDLYELVLGSSWRESGLLAQVLIIPNLLVALSTGTDRLYFVLERQRQALLCTIVGFALSLLSMLFVALLAARLEWFAVAWAISHMIFVVILVATIYNIARFTFSRLLSRWLSVLAVIVAMSVPIWGWSNPAWREAWWPWTLGAIVAASYAIGAWRMVLHLSSNLRRS